MSNTMTNLIPVLWGKDQIVPRELSGFVAASKKDFDAKGAAQGDTIKVPVVSSSSVETYTPAMTTTAGTDTTPTTVTIPLNVNAMKSWNLTGEEERSLENGGDNAMEFMRQKVEGGIRKIVNAMESALFVAAYKAASRAVGTAATTPFATAAGISGVNQALKVLLDNGIPNDDSLSLVIDSAAALNLRNLVTLNNNADASLAGRMLASGELMNISGMSIKESAGIVAHTVGTGTGYQANGAQAFGATSLTIDTGSGTVVAGDVISFADESPAYKYVVNTALSAGTVVIGAPGIFSAGGIVTGKAMTSQVAYTPNVALHKDALVLVSRPPIIPANGNIEQSLITDAKTGLSFLFCRVVGDGMTTYRIHMLYGVKAVQSEAIAILMG